MAKDMDARAGIERLKATVEEYNNYRIDLMHEFEEVKEQLGWIEVKYCKKCKHETIQRRHWDCPDDYACLTCGTIWKYTCERVAKEVK